MSNNANTFKTFDQVQRHLNASVDPFEKAMQDPRIVNEDTVVETYEDLGAALINPPNPVNSDNGIGSRVVLKNGDWFDVRRVEYDNPGNFTIIGTMFGARGRRIKFKMIDYSNPTRADVFQFGDPESGIRLEYGDGDLISIHNTEDEALIEKIKEHLTHQVDAFQMLLLLAVILKDFDGLWHVKELPQLEVDESRPSFRPGGKRVIKSVHSRTA